LRITDRTGIQADGKQKKSRQFHKHEHFRHLPFCQREIAAVK
jgi:hypothetical protein